MGQYFLIVNPAKRQYLTSHAFGAGLKLMEFTNQEHGPLQAMAVLMADSNGRGGGDLGTDGLTDAELALIGSWAGDPVYVTGDYADYFINPTDGKHNPYTQKLAELLADLDGKEYTVDEYEPNFSGPVAKWPKKKVTHKFGTRINKDTGKPEPKGENLYDAAQAFFEDISDKVITVVAKGEGGCHPWAAIDLAATGWRQVPEWGVLPKQKPKKPAGGAKLYKEYAKHATTALQNATDIAARFIADAENEGENPDELLAELTRKVGEIRKRNADLKAEREKRGW